MRPDAAVADEPDCGDSAGVFRVRVSRLEQSTLGLEEFYRESIKDLLQVVGLYFKGKPVLIDAFAFLNRPDRQVRILPEGDHRGHDPRAAQRSGEDSSE